MNGSEVDAHTHDSRAAAVVSSDDAGQFAMGRHALCRVHAERLVHKLDAFTDHNRAAQHIPSSGLPGPALSSARRSGTTSAADFTGQRLIPPLPDLVRCRGQPD